jgi:hypothetical protein
MIDQFPSQNEESLKAALYLYGHGPYREPRMIEMQYFRTLRYCAALEEKLGREIDIENIYIDLNFPRTYDPERLYNLQNLLKDIVKQEIDTVIIDICEEDSFNRDRYAPVIWSLKRVGAKVYNCYYDDDGALLATLTKRYGENVSSFMIPNDREEFVELFPALAANVTYEALEDRLSQIPAGNNDPFVHYVFQRIHSLGNKNPYNASSLPWLSDKKLRELYRQKQMELEKRRSIEDTYLLGPGQPGKLFDEDVGRVRSKESLNWIFNRLEDLGFHHHIDEMKHTFTMKYDRHLIYADPRVEGSFRVFVYKNEAVEEAGKKRRKNDSKYPIGDFTIQDSWKNDLATKLASRIEDIIRRR